MTWAVVSIENSENWLWFLSNLGSDFNLAMGAYLTILSDGHKGLIEAIKKLLPHAEHRLCTFMELIKNIDPLAYDWLMEKDPKAWCRAYFQMDRIVLLLKMVYQNHTIVL
ncbi:multidrug resistance-associated protein 5 [Tanacetum coccineum]